MEFSVYVKVDDAGRVIDINSSMFLKNTDGWTEIARGVGDAFQHAQANFLSKPIYNMGIPMFKMEKGEIKERSAEEINSDIKPAEKPMIEKRIDRIETVLNNINELITKITKGK